MKIEDKIRALPDGDAILFLSFENIEPLPIGDWCWPSGLRVDELKLYVEKVEALRVSSKMVLYNHRNGTVKSDTYTLYDELANVLEAFNEQKRV